MKQIGKYKKILETTKDEGLKASLKFKIKVMENKEVVLKK